MQLAKDGHSEVIKALVSAVVPFLGHAEVIKALVSAVLPFLGHSEALKNLIWPASWLAYEAPPP